ncbi:MAG: hypothetical protein WDZ76_04285 [Pseudohongiellaceae bacterium]
MRNKSFPLIISLLVLALVSLALAGGIGRKIHLDRSSHQMALEITESLFRERTLESLFRNGHSTLLQSTSEKQWQRYLDLLGRLGSLDYIHSITGRTTVPLLPDRGREILAGYDIDVQFSNSAADIAIDLIYERGSWKVASYIVSSGLTDN